MAEQEYHEPWELRDDGTIWRADDDFVAQSGEMTFDRGYLLPDNADRIVACVNACRDIPQDILERVANGRGFNDIISGMMQQKFPKSEGHWTQQFKEDPDGRVTREDQVEDLPGS